MSTQKLIRAPSIPREQLPTMYELPSEDPEEPGLPDEFHYHQPQLLRETFCPPSQDIDGYFVAMDLNLYYDVTHTSRYKRPDWFAVLNHTRFYEQQRDLRLSYVIWQEQVAPYLIVELLSPGSEKEDLGQAWHDAAGIPGKWEVYEQYLQVPYYVVFSRYTDELHFFMLKNGRYQEQHPQDGRLWLPEAQLGLGLWSGRYDRFAPRQWLRFYDANGEWIATPAERERHQQQRAEQAQQQAEQAQQQAEQAQQQAEQERQRAERLAAQLRDLGIDPD